MTDDYRNDGYSLNPRPYNYFKVKFTVYNKITCSSSSQYFYISSKNTLKWLTAQVPYAFKYPLPRDYFNYEYQFQEVADDDRITFHHITTKEDWERTATKYFLTVCALSRWRVSPLKKIEKILKKIGTFLSNQLFINVTTVKV